ncbi:MAG TPA: hypothetical protein VGP25_13950 [Gemmatimonadaceae bacterium]|jgi:hypothetical protein|nr:hypothetical protein [Gemmatimonadaceae bacterium]
MTSTIDHLSFDQLCELADAPVTVPVHAAWRDHLTACSECASQLAALASLRAQARRLPSEVAPPPELWAGIRAELAPRERAHRASRWHTSRWGLAAAALLVAVSSSAVTMVALRARERASTTAAATRPVAATTASKLPAHLASAELGYARSVAALRHTLDERRDSLATSTVETVERSLRIADAAIAEAREALERDPSNGVLVEIFTSNYERKIDLLRRATELAPRT